MSSSKFTLAFDFSARRGSLCLWQDETLLVRWNSPPQKALSPKVDSKTRPKALKAEVLPSIIAKTLRDARVSPRQLNRLCVVRGPGSYTGLRASLAAAKGLALGLTQLEVYSLTSFEAAISNIALDDNAADNKGGYILALVESFRSDWYGQAFHQRNHKANHDKQPLGEPRVVTDDGLRVWVSELLAQLSTQSKNTTTTNSTTNLLLCGGAAPRAWHGVLQSFVKTAQATATHAPALHLSLCEPSAQSLCEPSAQSLCEPSAQTFSRALVAGTPEEKTLYKRGAQALIPVYHSAL